MISRFIQGSKGSLLVTFYLPSSSPIEWVICFPPFAEEMNKSRAMMSAQARAWQEKGVAVLIPDLYGTGDSDGDFSEANWRIWIQDYLQLFDWIAKNRSSRIHFWGIRLGCLLAKDVSSRLGKPPDSFIFWQPVSRGEQAMTQFLRLRMAASMMGGEQEKVSDLRLRLTHGESLEVAGYEISPGLVKNIDSLSMQKMAPSKKSRVLWFEVVSREGKSLPMITQKIIEAWEQGGVSVDTQTVVGDQFWLTQELTLVPDLIQKTVDSLGEQFPLLQACQSEKPFSLPQQVLNNELPVQFACHGETLSAVLHQGAENSSRGMLLVVGGPQYRVGSHRQFVLLARDLARQGIPVFRFDYRGIGDSSGLLKGFDGIGDDIRSAIGCFQKHSPQVTEVVIWGLCDAATAATFYAPGDARVKGLVLLNPWVRSEQGQAKTYIKHYYLQRFLSIAFWKKLLRGQLDIIKALKSFMTMTYKISKGDEDVAGADEGQSNNGHKIAKLASRMETDLAKFGGEVMLILSGNDLTAAEFSESVKASNRFKKLITQNRFKVEHMKTADHTFSRRIWRDAVSELTVKWIKSW